MNKPVVALVGRPNVGKSTLFNRLIGERLAIVDEVPGTTRDRLFGECEWNGKRFDVVDTGGIDPASSRSVPLSIGSSDFITQIRSQAQIAVDEADAILFLVDAKAGVTPADIEVAQILRRSQKMINGKAFPEIFLVANKADNVNMMNMVQEFYELGMGQPHAISGLHGMATGDLLDELVKIFPEQIVDDNDDRIKIAIVGKPNVGKSSLLNCMIGEERAIVSDIAGTTRDSLDTEMIYEGKEITIIDTAGIRRRGKIDPGVEKFSVIRSMRSIERCDVAMLMIDASEGITAQDTHIAGYILDEWKSVVVVVNKWDLIEKDSYTMQEYTEKIRYELNFMSYVPIVFISAKTNQRVDKVLPLAVQVYRERMVEIGTGALNRVLRHAQDLHAPTSKSGKALKIYYGTQVRKAPPTFMLYVNDPKLAHFTYERFLMKQIREEYEFLGTPIRLVLKARRRTDY
jgi:GTP-binding protein